MTAITIMTSIAVFVAIPLGAWAAMIKVYRTPSLAKWHVEYTNESEVIS